MQIRLIHQNIVVLPCSGKANGIPDATLIHESFKEIEKVKKYNNLNYALMFKAIETSRENFEICNDVWHLTIDYIGCHFLNLKKRGKLEPSWEQIQKLFVNWRFSKVMGENKFLNFLWTRITIFKYWLLSSKRKLRTFLKMTCTWYLRVQIICVLMSIYRLMYSKTMWLI